MPAVLRGRLAAIAVLAGFFVPGAGTSLHAQTAAPSDAVVYIIYPHDGQRIRGAFPVRFGLRNMGVTHAGDTTPNMGHHHLLVDVQEDIDPNEPLPTDKQHIHFGAGQTETRLDLPPGRHTLQLVLGDAEHRPFKPMLISKKVTITVLPPRGRRAPQTSRAER
ncbi:DUF4399 domain-containing protein [Microvirga puerhi]|uniref:DUF4399 domain-containing protein n=1 Tax=Microvirga puerhi TaxID=2876078 RepID=A0ABS7VQQ0_9HYPH|nr:DUF4399 domain-containing protein [Microvirga puerhi]MBZ6077544.1 DUF4399 domain-containing protein [Microvirga puerhi]